MLAAAGFLVVLLTLLSPILALWAVVGLVSSVRRPSRRLCIPAWGGLAAAFVAFVFMQDGARSGATLALESLNRRDLYS